MSTVSVLETFHGSQRVSARPGPQVPEALLQPQAHARLHALQTPRALEPAGLRPRRGGARLGAGGARQGPRRDLDARRRRRDAEHAAWAGRCAVGLAAPHLVGTGHGVREDGRVGHAQAGAPHGRLGGRRLDEDGAVR